MQNGSKRTMRVRRSGPVPSPNRWTSNAARPEPRSQNAQRTYEQYLALARAEAQVGMIWSSDITIPNSKNFPLQNGPHE